MLKKVFQTEVNRITALLGVGCSPARQELADTVDAGFLSFRVGGSSWPAADLVPEADSELQRRQRHQPHGFLEERLGPLRPHTPPEARSHVRTGTDAHTLYPSGHAGDSAVAVYLPARKESPAQAVTTGSCF